MAITRLLNTAEVNFVVQQYTSKKATQSELALSLGVSSVTIRRLLAEKKLKKLKGYKTDSDEEILNYLEMRGITNINQLKGVLANGNTP